MNPSISTHEDRSVYANKIGSLLHQQNSMYPIVTNLILTSTPKPSVYIWLNRKLVSHSTEGTATVSSAERPICSGSIQRPDHSMFSIRLGFILTLWTTSPSLGGQLRLIGRKVKYQYIFSIPKGFACLFQLVSFQFREWKVWKDSTMVPTNHSPPGWTRRQS